MLVVIRVELYELHTRENTYVRVKKFEWLVDNKLGLDFLLIGHDHGLTAWLRLLNRGVAGLWLRRRVFSSFSLIEYLSQGRCVFSALHIC